MASICHPLSISTCSLMARSTLSTRSHSSRVPENATARPEVGFLRDPDGFLQAAAGGLLHLEDHFLITVAIAVVEDHHPRRIHGPLELVQDARDKIWGVIWIFSRHIGSLGSRPDPGRRRPISCDSTRNHGPSAMWLLHIFHKGETPTLHRPGNGALERHRRVHSLRRDAVRLRPGARSPG